MSVAVIWPLPVRVCADSVGFGSSRRDARLGDKILRGHTVCCVGAPPALLVGRDTVDHNVLAKYLATAVHMRFEIHSNVWTFPVKAKAGKNVALVW